MTEGNHYEPTAQDVLCGRGGLTNSHAGNIAFRSIVADHQREYLAARKKDKALIARRIVSIISGNGGRFLRKNSTTGEWEECTVKKAAEKTSQALREGLDVRRKVIKSPRRDSETSASVNPASKRQKVAKSVSWDDSVPSLNEYDAGETTTLPELRDEVLFHFQFAPPVLKEECEYVASV
jgi:hypothetical protein